jgi:hypothetical protein
MRKIILLTLMALIIVGSAHAVWAGIRTDVDVEAARKSRPPLIEGSRNGRYTTELPALRRYRLGLRQPFELAMGRCGGFFLPIGRISKSQACR